MCALRDKRLLPGSTLAYQLFKLMQFGSNLLLSVLLVRVLGKGSHYYAWESLMLGVGALTGICTYAQSLLFGQTWLRGQRLRAHWIFASTLGVLAASMLALMYVLTSFVDMALLWPGLVLVCAGIGGQDAENWLLKRQMAGWLLVTGTLYMVLYALAIALPLLWGWPLQYAAWGAAGVVTLRYVFYSAVAMVAPARKLPAGTVAVQPNWRLFMPLLAVALISTGTQYLDKALVRWLDTPDAFQLFSLAARELPFALILANALSLAVAGRIADAGAVEVATLRHLRSQSVRLMHISFPLAALLMLGSSWLFARVYGPDFAPAAQVFNVYLLLVIPRMLFPQSLLLGMRYNATVLRVATMEALIHTALTLALVPFMGYAGAAWATVVAFCADKTLLYIHARRYNLHALQATPWRPWMIYSILLVACWLASYFYSIGA